MKNVVLKMVTYEDVVEFWERTGPKTWENRGGAQQRLL